MSLFGRRNLNLDEITKALVKGKKRGKEKDDPKTLSQRKKSKRVFQIAETPLEIDPPVFGKRGRGGVGAASSITSSFLSSSPDSDSDSESLFPKLDFGTSKSSSSSTSGSRKPKPNMDTSSAPPNKIVEAALASSKLTAITSKGPIEASPKVGKRKVKASKKHEKSLTKGALWFNMAKTEVTKDKKNDLDVLKLRGAMAGIHHYKRNNITHTPKYFQVGTIVETKADFYSARIPKKQRKKTLAQEFAAEFGAL